MSKLNGFAKYAWGVLAYNILVILWGAYVRATGSGAGCGSHWPLCNGEVIPRAESVETLIEFTHRTTSGLAGIFVLILIVWAWRAYPKGHIVRTGAALSLFFIITEGLVGAGLVLFEWVAHDASLGRVISMGVHLINTFLLLAVLTLTAWWASGGRRLQLRGQGLAGWALALGFLGMLVLGVTGSMTALGDTLFPSASLAEGIRQDFLATSHFLVRLRVFHPLVAIGVGAYLVFVSGLLAMFRGDGSTKRFAIAFSSLFGIQLLAGLINLLLRAPVWMQLVHLFLADAVWITLVLFAAVSFAAPETEVQRLDAAQPAGLGEAQVVMK